MLTSLLLFNTNLQTYLIRSQREWEASPGGHHTTHAHKGADTNIVYIAFYIVFDESPSYLTFYL